MDKKILVACFSASGVTQSVAETLAQAADADLYPIRPQVPYTPADLDWRDKTSRSTLEMNDLTSRPAILDDPLDLTGYDTVLLGFPIWWYVAPTIVNTFLEKHDFSGKRLILFATSGGSGFGKTAEKLRPSVSPSTVIIEGKVFPGRLSPEEAAVWLRDLI